MALDLRNVYYDYNSKKVIKDLDSFYSILSNCVFCSFDEGYLSESEFEDVEKNLQYFYELSLSRDDKVLISD